MKRLRWQILVVVLTLVVGASVLIGPGLARAAGVEEVVHDAAADVRVAVGDCEHGVQVAGLDPHLLRWADVDLVAVGEVTFTMASSWT